jgi:hypothetical protein
VCHRGWNGSLCFLQSFLLTPICLTCANQVLRCGTAPPPTPLGLQLGHPNPSFAAIPLLPSIFTFYQHALCLYQLL